MSRGHSVSCAVEGLGEGGEHTVSAGDAGRGKDICGQLHCERLGRRKSNSYFLSFSLVCDAEKNRAG